MSSGASTKMPNAILETMEARARTASGQAFTLRDLDVEDTTILKALAIIAIVLHNFFHLFGPTHQNEFTFNPARFPLLLHTLLQPSLAIQAFFAFFGHFGVQIFIFLSAYGLAKSHWDDQSSWPAFMWGRIKKLYPTIGLVVLPWFVLSVLNLGTSVMWHTLGPQTVLMLLGVSTLLGYGLPAVGPWWFIPFIMQFYALWLPMRYLAKRYGLKVLVVLAGTSLAALSVVNLLPGQWGINLLLTPFGRMTSLCLGVVAARYPIRIHGRTGALVGLSGALLLVLGSFYFAFFPISFLGATLFCLWLYVNSRGVLRRIVLLEIVGRYSMLMFLLNGIVRFPFLVLATTPAKQLIFGTVSLVVTFLISGMIYELLVNPRGLRSAFRAETTCPQAS